MGASVVFAAVVVVGVAVHVFVIFHTTPPFAYGHTTGIGSGVTLGKVLLISAFPQSII